MKFMKKHEIYLTPLTPIHIGCGEDFEPTNYIVDNQILYHFDPSKIIPLDDNIFREFSKNTESGDFRKIHNFFKKNKNFILNNNLSHYQVLSPKEFQSEWENKDIIRNRLQIERNSYLHAPFHQPYIPASSVKGALVTAILDFKYTQDKNKNPNYKILHTTLLKKYIGEFEHSLLRFVKFSDFMPKNENVITRIFYAKNFKKKYEANSSSGERLTTRRESIVEKQYRAFYSELILMSDKKKDFIFDVQKIIRMLNTFYLSIFEKEMKLLIDRKLCDDTWLEKIKDLINNENIALIRLGKNGSDSKVYQDRSITSINVKKTKKFEKLPESTTLWLASESTSSGNKYPFGWALLEFNPKEDNQQLLNYCKKKLPEHFKKSDFIGKQKVFLEKLASEKEKQKQEQQAKELKLKTECEEKERLIKSASENQLLIIQFVDKIKETKERQSDNTGSLLLKEMVSLLEQAINWNVQDQTYLKENLTIDLLKSIVDFKKKDTEKNLKKAFNKLIATN